VRAAAPPSTLCHGAYVGTFVTAAVANNKPVTCSIIRDDIAHDSSRLCSVDAAASVGHPPPHSSLGIVPGQLLPQSSPAGTLLDVAAGSLMIPDTSDGSGLSYAIRSTHANAAVTDQSSSRFSFSPPDAGRQPLYRSVALPLTRSATTFPIASTMTSRPVSSVAVPGSASYSHTDLRIASAHPFGLSRTGVHPSPGSGSGPANRHRPTSPRRIASVLNLPVAGISAARSRMEQVETASSSLGHSAIPPAHLPGAWINSTSIAPHAQIRQPSAAATAAQVYSVSNLDGSCLAANTASLSACAPSAVTTQAVTQIRSVLA